MIVRLTTPITIAGKPVTEIDVRPPGRGVFDTMLAAGSGRFSRGGTVRFVSRLSGLNERVLERLEPEDFKAIREALAYEFNQARRARLRKRSP